MAVDFTPPRYAQMVAALQQRIESGAYPPGSLLPSENQLIAEFGVSRTTVTRALHLLRQDGWIESQQGRGTFVRGRPAAAGRVRHGQEVVDRADTGPHTKLLGAGTGRVPARVAAALGAEEGATAVYRRRLSTEDDGTPAACPPPRKPGCSASPAAPRSSPYSSPPATPPAASCRSPTPSYPPTGTN